MCYDSLIAGMKTELYTHKRIIAGCYLSLVQCWEEVKFRGEGTGVSNQLTSTPICWPKYSAEAPLC